MISNCLEGALGSRAAPKHPPVRASGAEDGERACARPAAPLGFRQPSRATAKVVGMMVGLYFSPECQMQIFSLKTCITILPLFHGKRAWPRWCGRPGDHSSLCRICALAESTGRCRKLAAPSQDGSVWVRMIGRPTLGKIKGGALVELIASGRLKLNPVASWNLDLDLAVIISTAPLLGSTTGARAPDQLNQSINHV